MKTLRHPGLAAVASRWGRLAGACLVLAFSGGCAGVSAAKSHLVADNSVYVPANYAGEPRLPAGVRRVVVLPVAGGTAAEVESAASLDAVIVAALQQQSRFEVVPVTRDDFRLHFNTGEVSSVARLPANLLEVLHREYGADAVLFVDVTVYHAYQPLAIGLRAKLAMIDDARLVWTFDNVFSSDNPAVARGAARYLQERQPDGVPSELGSVALQSPTRFASYAAMAMFATLPPVNGPAEPPKAGHETANAHSSAGQNSR